MNASLLSVSLGITLLVVFVGVAGAADPPDADPLLKGFEERTLRFTGGDLHGEPLKYLVLKPEKIEPGKTYPVVLYLHGAGERGDDNRLQLKYFPESMSRPERRQRYEAFVIAPQCRTGKMWVGMSGTDRRAVPQTAEPNESMQAAIAMLQEVLKNEPVDRRRVYLTGLSMGGYGSWDLAMRHPDWFAAVAPVCGGGDESHADRLAHLPVWAFHGARDPAVPVARSRQMIEAVRKAGGEPKYTEYPDVGHSSWEKAYADDSGLLDWMFQQVRPE